MIPDRKFTPAFTLIELLIVIALIAVLVSITLVVTQKVISTGKRTTTENVIQILDITLQSASEGNRGIPATVGIPEFEYIKASSERYSARDIVWPMSDVVLFQSSDPPFNPKPALSNSVGLFMYYVEKFGNETARVALSKLPTKFTRLYDPDAVDGRMPTKRQFIDADRASTPTPWEVNDGQFELMTAFDGWGKPIRMVHPALDGVFAKPSFSQRLRWRPIKFTDDALASISVKAKPGWQWGAILLRRDFRSGNATDRAVEGDSAFADSDAGVCDGATPYFYSSGPDGLVGFNDTIDQDVDNIYTRFPKFPDSRLNYDPDETR